MSSTQSGTLKIIAYNLRYFRERIGATQEEVAEGAQISYRLYQSLESGKANPTIESISRLAVFFKVPSHKLLKLSFARLKGAESEFIERFKKTFHSFHRIAVIRNLEGTVIWCNPTVFKYLKVQSVEFPMNLLDTLPSSSREVVRNQLEFERRGLIQPYLNVTTGPNGEWICLRLYPTLIMPKNGSVPLFSAVYSTAAGEDSEEDYSRYCDLLLNCFEI